MVATQGYLDETCRVDLGRLDGPRHDPENVARLLRSLARCVATEASASTIGADVAGADGQGAINYHTVIDYLRALTRLFIVEDLPAWSPALRSRGVLRSSVTRHFVDPSLAAAALGAGPDRLLRDPETLGLLFESLVVRDLRVYGQAIGASASHYRENTGAEADAILHMRSGQWAAVEVKLGQGDIDKGANSLLRVAANVDPERHGHPAFLAVVTGWGYAYRRSDGVFVVPVGTLTS
jgi:predicted AAA+ superfamily ATPase